MTSGGNAYDFCSAESETVHMYGCTVGFAGFRTVDGGGAALIVKAYYEEFGGERLDLRTYLIPGNGHSIRNSNRSAEFCTRFCADFKTVATRDRAAMIKAQSYAHAVFYALPTKQISAALKLTLPLSIAAIYAGVVNHGYNAMPGENMQINLKDTRGGTIERVLKEAGSSPADGTSELIWLKRYLQARSSTLYATSSFSATVQERTNTYMALLVGSTFASSVNSPVQNLNLTPPVVTTDLYGFTQKYQCFQSGLPTHITASKNMPALDKRDDSSTQFAGMNSYFLWAYPSDDQKRILDQLNGINIKVVRIFITHIAANAKSTNVGEYSDLEEETTGTYNNAVLDQIDTLMVNALAAGIKLIICMHDRYNLDGTWGCDGYCKNYNIRDNGLDTFYNGDSDSQIVKDFDNRLAHIANYATSNFDGRAWKNRPEVIYALEIQNEAQADGSGNGQSPPGLSYKVDEGGSGNPSWWCDRAKALKKNVPDLDDGILISTGGGQDFPQSLVSANFKCDEIDIIALHSYTQSTDEVDAALDTAIKSLKENSPDGKKTVILEEFGWAGNQGNWIDTVAPKAINKGISWMPWEVIDPTNNADLEFYNDDSGNLAWGKTSYWAKQPFASSPQRRDSSQGTSYTPPKDPIIPYRRDTSSVQTPFAGVNSYFIWAYEDADQIQILKDVAAAGIKVIRIFITGFGAYNKGTNIPTTYSDIEESGVGSYNDLVLQRIDRLLLNIRDSKLDLKLIICMHDRYNLDSTWGTCDGYCQKYVNSDLNNFYKASAGSDVHKDFDKRLQHIANFKGDSIKKTWKTYSDGIYAFEIQNEGQANGAANGGLWYNVKDDYSVGNPDWWCDRAKAFIANVGDVSPILVSTGGGQEFSQSLVKQNFECDALDVIALHSYTTSLDEVTSSIKTALDLNSHGKIIIFEEFGWTQNQASWIASVAEVAIAQGVSWMPWQVANPTNFRDFEFYTDDTATWDALKDWAQKTIPSESQYTPSDSQSEQDQSVDTVEATTSSTSWAGVNSYFLWAYPDEDQTRILEQLKQANIKVIRVYITHIGKQAKGTNVKAYDDIEETVIGKYNSDQKVLSRVDLLMRNAKQHGIKLIICMHDRYNLDGTWGCDAYCQKYNLKSAGLDAFYKADSGSQILSDFDNRLAYIANYKSPTPGSKPWSQWSDGIYAFEIQNEAQADGSQNGQNPPGTKYKVDSNGNGNPSWWCDRAKVLKNGALQGSSILLGTGGGQDLASSLLAENFNCPYLDLIGVHHFSSSSDDVDAALGKAKTLIENGNGDKTIILESFGKAGDQAAWIGQIAQVAHKHGISWLPWQVVDPTSSKDYEFYNDDSGSDAWKELTKWAGSATASVFSRAHLSFHQPVPTIHSAENLAHARKNTNSMNLSSNAVGPAPASAARSKEDIPQTANEETPATNPNNNTAPAVVQQPDTSNLEVQPDPITAQVSHEEEAPQESSQEQHSQLQNELQDARRTSDACVTRADLSSDTETTPVDGAAPPLPHPVTLNDSRQENEVVLLNDLCSNPQDSFQANQHRPAASVGASLYSLNQGGNVFVDHEAPNLPLRSGDQSHDGGLPFAAGVSGVAVSADVAQPETSSGPQTSTNAHVNSDKEKEKEEQVPPVMRELHFQLIPFVPQGQQPNPTVDCVERKIREGEIVRIGRKVIKNGVEQLLEGQKDSPLNIWYQSKVVSRSHAEIWIQDGQLFVKDSGSSSGTFLNKMRLSPSGKESKPFTIRENDLLVFGVDYKGKTDGDDLYKCVSVRIGFYDNTWIKQLRKKANPEKFRKALKALLNASNPHSAHTDEEDDSPPEDCCICIGEILPLQAIFISPCSHSYHYKCVSSLLMQSQMFQCPMCRQVANLAASVSTESLDGANNKPFTSDARKDDADGMAHGRGETAVPPEDSGSAAGGGVGGGSTSGNGMGSSHAAAGAPVLPHLNIGVGSSSSSSGSPSPGSAGSSKSFWGKTKDGRPGSGKGAFGGFFHKKKKGEESS
ncbi:hypothetical protein HDU80_006647 [Chytriomyces hyalinus]|nr:hypothetical protein HDU80_006647 [Chytriomyces hyalinus]